MQNNTQNVTTAKKALAILVTLILITLASWVAWQLGKSMYGIVQFMYKMEGQIGALKVLLGFQAVVMVLACVMIYADYDINRGQMRVDPKYRQSQKYKWRFWFIWVCIPGVCYLFPAVALIALLTRSGLKIATFFTKFLQLVFGRRETMD